MSSFPPGLLLILGAALVPLLRGRVRQGYLMLLPLISFLHLTHLPLGSHGGFEFLDYDLALVRVDHYSLLFGYAFHVALFIGTVFAVHVKDPVQHVAALIYAGATLCATFAGDLLTLFVFWEVAAVASVFLIWARRTERAYAVGMRYLIYQVVSGLLLLAGILINLERTGSLAFDHFGLSGELELDSLLASTQANPGAWLILLAFGIKCAFPLLHTWLTDAYPEATPTGSVFLSAFTTKLAVYALLRGFSDSDLLVAIGTVMALFPIFYAVIENDLRRVLSYSLINQVGFMVVGIGVGTTLALNGATAQVFTHIVFKSLLFMTMGAVLHTTGTVKASELGGLYKSMPFTTACCLVGAATISAFPFFSSFASKSLIMDGTAAGHPLVWFLLLFAAAGVLHHAGIKIPFCAFFAHDSGKRPPRPPWNMRVAMGLAAALCIGIGVWPELLYGLLPFQPVDYTPYTLEHGITQVQLLGFAFLAFVVLTRAGFHPHELPSVNLDVDWFLRRPLLGAWRWLEARLASVAQAFEKLVLTTLPGLAVVALRNCERGVQRSRWMMLGSSVLVTLMLLILYLLLGNACD